MDGAPERESVRLGRAIRHRRGALDLTQPELADRAGVSLAYVYMLETGSLPHPGLDNLLRVAKAVDDARLTELLEEVLALRGREALPQSVEDVATTAAVARYLRETGG